MFGGEHGYGFVVSATHLPPGRYVTCGLDANPDAGGQLRALLMRNRILVREAGISPDVLTFRPDRMLAERREVLLERGMLVPEISLHNIYEHYRLNAWDLPGGTGRKLRDLTAHVVDEAVLPDGTPWRTTYRLPRGGRLVHDYLRPDGSPYLRIPDWSHMDPGTWPSRIQAVTKAGEVARTFRSPGQWYRLWVRQLTRSDERAFVFIDSRHVVPHLVPMRARHVHLIYVLHNIHLKAPRRWDSDLVSPIYRHVLDRIPGMDAMVTLTYRQRDDIAQRHGSSDNLFVVPNPVELPEPVDDIPRDPRRVAMVARLETQKRPTEAVRAFARVKQRVPDAHLDIYGSGSRMKTLRRQIERLGITDAVTVHGYDPHARDALWRASAFVMTSAFEGYPLSTLESLSHGCPVVSYDIKYGPREQITEGVDGFLVPEGDTVQLAERVVRLLTSPELVERMSLAAVEKAERHGNDQFLSDWAHVLEAVVRQKRDRTRIRAVDLDVRRLTVREGLAGRLPPGGAAGPALGTYDRSQRLAFDGVLRVRGKGPAQRLDSARVELRAVHARSGEVVDLPITWHRTGRRLHVRSRVRLGDLFGPTSHDEVVKLRLRLVWHNSVWQTFLTRPRVEPATVQLAYDERDTLLIRGSGTTDGATDGER